MADTITTVLAFSELLLCHFKEAYKYQGSKFKDLIMCLLSTIKQQPQVGKFSQKPEQHIFQAIPML